MLDRRRRAFFCFSSDCNGNDLAIGDIDGISDLLQFRLSGDAAEAGQNAGKMVEEVSCVLLIGFQAFDFHAVLTLQRESANQCGVATRITA